MHFNQRNDLFLERQLQLPVHRKTATLHANREVNHTAPCMSAACIYLILNKPQSDCLCVCVKFTDASSGKSVSHFNMSDSHLIYLSTLHCVTKKCESTKGSYRRSNLVLLLTIQTAIYSLHEKLLCYCIKISK